MPGIDMDSPPAASKTVLDAAGNVALEVSTDVVVKLVSVAIFVEGEAELTTSLVGFCILEISELGLPIDVVA